jgi:GNAT superfamily N-acetyltransferase
LSPVVEVVRTYLELRSPEQLRPAPPPDDRVEFVKLDAITTSHYRALYDGVGDAHHWRDRRVWSGERLAAHLARSEITVWECRHAGEVAGFFELELRDDGSVEIAYFGLLPAFIGRGLGKAMLTRAAHEAWALGANRVWLHTCTLDSPHALANYKARGFTVTHQDTYVVQLA